VTSTVPAASSAQRGTEFAELSRRIRAAGLLERRPGWYARAVALAVGAFAACWTVFGLLGDSWWQLLVAAALAVVSTQLAYFGHDAGHKQILHGRRANNAIGHLHALLIGISFGWWVAKHNRHHANPNHEDEDPDLDIPVLAFSAEQARGRTGLLRWTAAHQAALFFPLLTLEGVMLHWAGIDAIARGTVRARALEGLLLAAHLGAYVAAVSLVLPPGKALAFVAVQKGLWGVLMGCAFAPNHKGMEMVRPGEKLDFLRKQVLTSRDVGGSRWVDVALGGLNHQVAHHLFPSMARPHLRLAQPLIEAFCAERGLPYIRCGLLASYRQVLRHLHAIGAPLREPRR
jgi:fatty acid desaturase